jgi:hypothetical protein
MSPEQTVRLLYEAYQARDWQAAEAVMDPDITLDMPATRERLARRAQVIAFQRDFPEPWGRPPPDRAHFILEDPACTD